MRHGFGLVMALLAFLLAGCATSLPVHPTAWFNKFRQGTQPTTPDIVQMDVALIERPLADAYINHDLWTDADEQVGDMDRQAVLKENGFRIGQIGGITPTGLQELLTSKHCCSNPRRIQTHAGKPTLLYLGPATPQARYQVVQQGGNAQVTLDQAQCVLEVVPTLAANGRTKLRFTPLVQHGERTMQPYPAPDHSGWILKDQQPTENYADMSWEITLAPNEYVVVGGRYDRVDSLGHQCFVRRDESQPVQRLLVIRTGRPVLTADANQAMPALEDHASLVSPSLACQAACTTARGTAP